MSDERIPVGTKVRYHGSVDYCHGEYNIIGYSNFDRRPAIFTPEVIAEHYPGGVAYELLPVGVPVKFGEIRNKAISFVRRESFTVIE